MMDYEIKDGVAIIPGPNHSNPPEGGEKNA
jgi:hypothetical protein